MNTRAIINGEEYIVDISVDGKYATIWSFNSADDYDFSGRFILKDKELIEYYPMSDTYAVVGRLKD